MLGITAGFFALLLAVGFGLGAILHAAPFLYLVLKLAGGAYIIWIAWKIGTSRGLSEGQSGAQPMTFLSAAAFQWVNPKAWVMTITAIATYTSETLYAVSVIIVCSAFALVNFPAIFTWVGFGSVLRDWLSDPIRLKWFNITMAILLVVSLWPMLK